MAAWQAMAVDKNKSTFLMCVIGSKLNSHDISIFVGDKLINPMVGVDIPIIRIPY